MAPEATTGFAAITARVRVMYSTLLNRQDFTNFSESSDLETLLTQLKHTAYGPYLERAKDKELTARRAAFLMRTRMSELFHSIINGSPEYTRPVLTQLYDYYQVNNLKAILRGIVTDSTWDRVRFVLFPVIGDNVLPAEQMLESRNVAQAIEMINSTQYYETLIFAMKRYSVEQSLFPIEVALDLDYWRNLWKQVKSLPKSDQDYAAKIIGPMLDMNNLMWAIRYRTYHHLSEEEIINYTLPIGYRVSNDDIHAVAAGADIEQIVKRIFPDIVGVDEMLSNLQTGLPRLELQLQKRVAAQCHSAFVGNPFQIGIPLGFLVLLDMEIQDLVVLLEGKSNQLPNEEINKFLIIS
jgi:V/A-type H+-transporting ATPase subunit C